MMAGVVILLMIWLAVCVDDTLSDNSTKSVIKFIEDRIESPDYDRTRRPGIDKGPIHVFVSINVNDISYINEAQMEFSITLFANQLWIDDRLAYSDTGYDRPISMNYNQYERVWTPDLYVANFKSGVFHKITVPNRRFRISPNGQVFYSQRITVTMFCDMMLERFPMDNQTCYIELGTYTWAIDNMILHWRVDVAAVEMTRVSLTQYTVTNVTNEDCTPSAPGSYPCLRAYFHLSRRLKMYILNTYIPSFLVVFLSWLSFYIDPEATPARASLGITSVLVMTTQSSGLINTVAYGTATNARDIWMAICLVYVFGAFIEYAAVNFSLRRQKQRKVEDVSCKSNENKGGMDEPLDVERVCVRRGGFWSLFDFKRDPAMALENASRILFPFTFFVFCLFYWPAYLL